MTLSSTFAALSHRLSAQNGVLRIEVDDKPGVTLVGVHYSINSQLSGVKAGRWNFDIRSKSGKPLSSATRNMTHPAIFC